MDWQVMAIATLFLLLFLAVMTDVRHHRIPNLIILIGLISGIVFQLTLPSGEGFFSRNDGSVGLLPSLAGIALGFLCPLPLYLLRAMGAGDVKLLMVVGAFLGPLQILGVLVLTFVAGGLLALLMTLYRHSFANLLMNLRFMLTTSAVRAASGESPRFDPMQQTAGRMPYAVAITTGTVLQLLLVRSGGWSLS